MNKEFSITSNIWSAFRKEAHKVQKRVFQYRMKLNIPVDIERVRQDETFHTWNEFRQQAKQG
jgi:hypothetical protein